MSDNEELQKNPIYLQNDLLTTKEAADFLGVSVQTLASGRCKTNKSAYKVNPKYTKLNSGKNGEIRYKKSDLLQWLSEKKEKKVKKEVEKEQRINDRKNNNKMARLILIDLFKDIPCTRSTS